MRFLKPHVKPRRLNGRLIPLGNRRTHLVPWNVDEYLFQGDTFAPAQRDRAEIASSAATARDPDYAKCRPMSDARNSVQFGTVPGDFPGKRFAPHCRLEERDRHILRLAINNTVDLPLVLKILLLDLPAPGTADNHFQVMLVPPEYRMEDETPEFRGVHRFHISSIEAGITSVAKVMPSGLCAWIPTTRVRSPTNDSNWSA